MYTLQSLVVKNLFSYEEASIDFKSGRPTLVYGNIIGKERSNGSGKSSILECIAIAFTGETLKDNKKDEFIRNGELSGEVSLQMYNPVLKKTVLITRFLHVKKSNSVELYEDNILRADLKDLHPRETDKEILSLLGITKDDLLNYYLISKEKYQSFFLSTDTVKKDVINRFSKADKVDDTKPLIDADLIVQKNTLSTLQNESSKLEGKIETLTEQLEEEKGKKFEDEKAELVKAEKKVLTEIQSALSDKQVELTKFRPSIYFQKLISDSSEKQTKVLKEIEKSESSIKKQLEKIKQLKDKRTTIEHQFDSDIKAKETAIFKLRDDISTFEDDNKDFGSFKSELEVKLQDEIECPSCHHKFSFRDKEFDIEEAKSQIKETQKEIDANVKAITEAEDQIKKLKGEVDEFRSKIKTQTASLEISITTEEKSNKEYQTLLDKENEISLALGKQINQYKIDEDKENKDRGLVENSIGELTSKIGHQKIKIKDAEKMKRDFTLQKKLENQIEEENKLLLEVLTKIVGVEEKIQNLELWNIRFKKFKSYLANSSIHSIEQFCNYYLQQMGEELSISIDGFRTKANGELKEEISIFISRDGLTQERFQKYSGGQRGVCDLACIFSMQKLINLTANSGGLDLIFVDEVLESIDAGGMREVVKAISKLSQTIILITHVAPESKFDVNSIVVEYNPITKISKIMPTNDEIKKVVDSAPLSKSKKESLKTSLPGEDIEPQNKKKKRGDNSK